MTARMPFPERPRSVVTGAAGGFGRAVAMRLAERRARLVVSDIDETGLEETADLARERGAEVCTIRCDVRDPSQVEAQAALADEAFGGTDIVVNNAGVAVAGHVGDVSLDDWRWQIDINLWGVIHGCHTFVPRLKAQKRGWILNVASIAGVVSAPQMAPYNVTKAGVIALSETLCAELAEDGVKVTALCPSFFRTNIGRSARGIVSSTQLAQKLVERADWTADQIAEIALRGLEGGELYVIPQSDGKLMWRAKRLLGAGFYRATPWLAGVLRAQAKRGARRA
jgi:NAD(P)-dependent dehydrogenase (short-subunit alcohol dehydrogenase family)